MQQTMQNDVPCALVLFPTKFMHSSSTGLEHCLGVRILLPLVGTFSDLLYILYSILKAVKQSIKN